MKVKSVTVSSADLTLVMILSCVANDVIAVADESASALRRGSVHSLAIAVAVAITAATPSLILLAAII